MSSAPPAGRSSSRRTSCPRSSGSATGWRSSGAGRLVALEDVADAPRAPEAARRAARPRPTARSRAACPASAGVAGRDGLLTCQLEGDVGPFLAAIAGVPVTDLTIEPAHLEEAFLEFYEGDGDELTSRSPCRGPLPALPADLARAAHQAAGRRVALAVWGSLMPVIYEAFKDQIQLLLGSGAIPPHSPQFGGGDLFTLAGTIALGFIHPIAVAWSRLRVGFAVTAVAGERQRGTLEVLLARPLSRRRLYATLLVATILFVALAIAAQVVGASSGLRSPAQR